MLMRPKLSVLSSDPECQSFNSVSSVIARVNLQGLLTNGPPSRREWHAPNPNVLIANIGMVVRWRISSEDAGIPEPSRKSMEQLILLGWESRCNADFPKLERRRQRLFNHSEGEPSS